MLLLNSQIGEKNMFWLADIMVDTINGSHLFAVIILASVIDIILGTIKGLLSKRLNSTISSQGIIKHVLMISIPPLTIPIFYALNYPDGWNLFAGLVLFTNVLSISENWIALGLPFPKQVGDYLDDRKKELYTEDKQD